MDRSRSVVARGWIVGACASIVVALATAPFTEAQGNRINGPLSRLSGGSVHDARISPDGVSAVYAADQEEPFTGGVFQLSPEAGVGRDVMDFQSSPDDAYVVFRGDLEVNGRDELFSVSITGGPSTKLNGPLVPEGDVRSFVFPFSWSISPRTGAASST